MVYDRSVLDSMLVDGHSMVDGGIVNGCSMLNSILNIVDSMVVYDDIFPCTSYVYTKQDTSCYRT